MNAFLLISVLYVFGFMHTTVSSIAIGGRGLRGQFRMRTSEICIFLLWVTSMKTKLCYYFKQYSKLGLRFGQYIDVNLLVFECQGRRVLWAAHPSQFTKLWLTITIKGTVYTPDSSKSTLYMLREADFKNCFMVN